MSFLTNLVRPGLKTTQKREVAANVWEKCPACTQLIYATDLPASLHCCPHCGHHLPWPLASRVAHLLEPGATPIPLPKVADDPLHFRDRKPYKTRLKEARASTGNLDAAAVWHGHILTQPLILAALNFDFMAGSMGRAVGQAVVVAAQAALAQRLPLLVITASGGARMQESTLALMQMARTTAAITALKQAGLPYVVLLTHPTTGGVTASFAMQGDIQLAEPGALIGFAGPRVIQQTIGQTLPEGFQTAEYLLAHGMLDAVVKRADHRPTLANLLNLLTNPSTPPKHPPASGPKP